MTREEAKKYLEEVLDGGYVSRLREAAANGGDEFASNMAETVQRALNTLGIRDNAGNVLTVNGVYDTPTIQAMGKFIRQSGYSASGVTQYSESRSTGGVNPGYDRAVTNPSWNPRDQLNGVYDAEEEIYNVFKNIIISSDPIKMKEQYEILMELFAKYFQMTNSVISAEMLRYSFASNPPDYVAGNNSTLANAMKSDTTLLNFIEKTVRNYEIMGRKSFDRVKITNGDGFAFPSGDLHYAINGITTEDSYVSGQRQADRSWKLTVHIEDVYDYAYSEYPGRNIKDQVISMGVNLARKAQEIGVINPYLVIVDFTMDYSIYS